MIKVVDDTRLETVTKEISTRVFTWMISQQDLNQIVREYALREAKRTSLIQINEADCIITIDPEGFIDSLDGYEIKIVEDRGEVKP